MLKKKKLVRLVAMIMTMAMLLSTGIAQVFAEDTTETQVRNSQIVHQLRIIEAQKEMYGLGNVNFSSLQIADPVQTYIYGKTGIEEGFLFYPLKVNGTMVAMAIETVEGEEKFYQIDTTIVDEVNAVLPADEEYTLIYDNDGCYLYDGTLHLVRQGTTSLDRGNLQSVSDLAAYQSVIDCAEVSSESQLGYTPTLSRDYAYRYYTYAVPIVRQVYDKICWAACLASISNARNGTSWTAAGLSQDLHGSTNPSVFNVEKNGNQIQLAADLYIGVNYSHVQRKLSDETMIENLIYGYPMIGGFENPTASTLKHVVVINGYYHGEDLINIMEPFSGVYLTGRYSLVQNTYVFTYVPENLDLKWTSTTAVQT